MVNHAKLNLEEPNFYCLFLAVLFRVALFQF